MEPSSTWAISDMKLHDRRCDDLLINSLCIYMMYTCYKEWQTCGVKWPKWLSIEWTSVPYLARRPSIYRTFHWAKVIGGESAQPNFCLPFILTGRQRKQWFDVARLNIPGVFLCWRYIFSRALNFSFFPDKGSNGLM